MDKSWKEKIKDLWWRFKRNRAIKILALVVFGLIALLAIFYAVLNYYGKLPWQTATTTLSDNSNEQIAPPIEVPATKRFPIAVMIENLVSIRPQSGLDKASVVYEALVEGGITRFMAIYTTDTDIPLIGPIRSARLYFVDLAEEYGGLYAYVGGSPQALGATDTSTYITDLNQYYNSEYYYRNEEISAPHNLFSNSELFSYALRDLNLVQTEATYRPFNLKDHISSDERPASVAPITINFSTADYQVEWHYNPATNLYTRWNGGVEQANITASDIIIQRAETTLLEPATGRLDIKTIGQGYALLFQDGAVETGSWVKTTRGERTHFNDASGSEWALNRGQTWIELVTLDTPVTY
ncbi:MAG: DUF3048 domain-containing protein [Patescibacteria group bacterium]|jgi:hypothetical protein